MVAWHNIHSAVCRIEQRREFTPIILTEGRQRLANGLARLIDGVTWRQPVLIRTLLEVISAQALIAFIEFTLPCDLLQQFVNFCPGPVAVEVSGARRVSKVMELGDTSACRRQSRQRE